MAQTRSLKKTSRLFWYRQTVVCGFFTIAAAALAGALISHNPLDPSWFCSHSGAQPISNWCGRMGAELAALLVYLFGAASLIVLAGFIIIMRTVWRKEPLKAQWDRFVATGVLLIAFAALSSLYAVDFLASPFPGGFVGHKTQLFAVRWFDTFGAFIFLHLLIMISLLVMTRISGIALIKALYLAIKKRGGMRYLVRTFIYIGNHTLRVLGTSLQWIVAAFSTVFGHLVLSRPDERAQIDYTMLVGESASSLVDDAAFWQTLAKPVEQESESVALQAEDEALQIKRQKKRSGQAGGYRLPDLDVFQRSDEQAADEQSNRELKERAAVMEEKLSCFGISGKVVAIKRGPVVTLFEYKPDIDAKISKIVALEDDLALALQAMSIRIMAPIPGTSVVGFEVANNKRKNVAFADVVDSKAFVDFQGALPLVLGKNTVGADIIVDLAKMPHLLIAGSTGSGKSVALNTMLLSLLCKCSPQELKLILIDPKRLEFTSYADIGHLLFPIVTNPKHALSVLSWVVNEMEQRYEQIAQAGARHVADYNKLVGPAERKPYLVVIIDELSDLMMTAGNQMENLITRIAQMARAAGIHMMVATQRPSVDVITGLIKVNFPSRISFRVTSKVDSRTILDCVGADKLLGRGDMLFLDATDAQLKRVHGAYVSDKEIAAVIAHVRAQGPAQYIDTLDQLPPTIDMGLEADDALYQQVRQFLQEVDEVSISLLQRRFRIGYNRSARIIEMLEAQGLIMPSQGKTRKVIR